jgi:ABC-type uncharacterized transport system permease subunit
MAVIGCLVVILFFSNQESRGDIIVLGVVIFLATAMYSGFSSSNLYKSTGVRIQQLKLGEKLDIFGPGKFSFLP